MLLLSVAFVLFAVGYVGYAASSLGRINTLPPLPDQYKPGTGRRAAAAPHPPTTTSPLDAKMIQAFGRECPELKLPIRLELNSKSMVMAASSFELVNGRLHLEKLSIALFGKNKNDGRGIEINTLKSNSAYLTFDRPITTLSEINGRKITEAEMIGDIMIVNNRRTPQRDDDLSLYIKTGPLYYNEQRQIIWTHDAIHLIDGQTKPPSEVRGKDMEMELATQAPPPRPGAAAAAHKPKNESISGVKRIVLKSDVNMHLYVSGQTPFPAGDKDKAGKPPAVPAKAPGEVSHVVVKTAGRFQYDIYKDHDMARFFVPEEGQASRSPQYVTVERIHEQRGNDQLGCHHLELRMRRRENSKSTGAAGAAVTSAAAPAPGPAAAEPAGEQGLEVETAHATGPEVTLTSDAEKLYAEGNDFFYDATKKLTILKGAPHMKADRDESLLYAPEMQIQDIVVPATPGTPAQTYQQVTARGPGSIHLPKKVQGEKTVHTVHAFWNDKLTSTKDGANDLLILTGKARFVQDENEQSMQAETLKVWLLPAEKKPAGAAPAACPAPAKAPAGPETGRKPHHLEAQGNVVASSRELNIYETGRLVVWFKDGPDPGGGKPATLPPGAKAPAPTAPKGVPAGAAGPPAPPPAAAKAPAGAPAAAKQAPAEPARPIHLSARSVEAWVIRSGDKNTLDEVWTEGNVKVRQEPAKPDEKGVAIEGDTLRMKYHPEGNDLFVTAGDVAKLRMDKILIFGPEINIEQATNKSWVIGNGVMQMESNTDLEGKPLGRTVPLTVHWNKDMFFNGGYAEFRGSIQAEQENALLACQKLQVFFDRPISLKEGNRGDQPAKVRSLVGDQEVRVEDRTLDKEDHLIKYQLLEGSVIAMNTEPGDDDGGGRKTEKPRNTNEVRLSGPGCVRILQRGATDLTAPPPDKANPPAQPPAEEMKMTYVSFLKRMDASSKTNTANFWEYVRVLNFPCDDPHREIDLDAMLATELPAGAMYMRCDRLKVRDRKVQGRSNQEMEAHGRVRVQAREFWAEAAEVDYNEAKDQVVFRGGPGGLATLSKVARPGVPPQTLQGKTIIYTRSTGKAEVIGGDSLNGVN
jgi:hypothetical protein